MRDGDGGVYAQSVPVATDWCVVSPQTEALGSFGEFVRAQRRLAALSQRELAKLTNLSDPYVSQLERGLHEPSLRVIKALAGAFNLRIDELLRCTGLIDEDREGGVPSTTEAIRADPQLSETQRNAMLSVYDSFVSRS